MNIKELKKLINEELNRKKLQEQPEDQPEQQSPKQNPEDVLLTLIIQRDLIASKKQDGNSNIHTTMSNIQNSIHLLQQRLTTVKSYIPTSAKELTLQEVYSSVKNDPETMDYIEKFLEDMGVPPISRTLFTNNAASELAPFNVQQPATNPGTPSAKQEQPPPPDVSPNAKTAPPSKVSQNPTPTKPPNALRAMQARNLKNQNRPK